jgi:hypothetical protein
MQKLPAPVVAEIKHAEKKEERVAVRHKLEALTT